MVLRQLHSTIFVGGCQMKKDYMIGLDIGTSSVGWAVVDCKNNQVIRKGNKKCWGVRLFEDANTAEERRISRGTRRRFDRRRKRIKLLRQEFQKEINLVDKDFFQKLNESFYHLDDTNNRTVAFLEEDKKLMTKYKTIYHLRKEAMETNKKMDIRLLYLAIHHIIKYRGNFLYDFKNFNVQHLNVEEKLKELFYFLMDNCETLELSEENLEMINYKELVNIFVLPSKNDKKVLIKEKLNVFVPKYFLDEFIKLIIGDSFDIVKLLRLEIEGNVKTSFKGSTFEDKIDEIEEKIGTNIILLEELKNLYDMVFLKNLFKGNEQANISSLMVERYNIHEQDLKHLKTILRANRKEYNKVFRTTTKYVCLYEKYVHNALSYAEFSKELNNILENVIKEINDNSIIEMYENIKKDIETENFMPRITDSDNGKYPYQLNKSELIKIIENQGKYYPFLFQKATTNTGEDYKIVKLLEFRIPYYVGPLNNTTNKKDSKNQNAWIIKKENNVIITPYNFHEVVDLDGSAEKFITRMIANCTYLINEPVMASNSILYSKFKVLNELKQISINDHRLSLEEQKAIYKGLFLRESGTITEKKFKDYLRKSNNYCMYDNYTIKGYSADGKFANNMQSYIDFFGENGIFAGTNYNEKDAEEIIRWNTIFEDKEILRRKIQVQYTDLSNEQLEKAVNKRYKGWSSLSEKLLTYKYYSDKVTKDKKSILDLMEETPYNFMQILNNKEYKFQDMITEMNQLENTNLLNYEVISKLAASPATKRGIFQSLKIVKEIIDYMGYEPKSITLEMARGEDKVKKRTNERKKLLEQLYDKCKKDIENYETLKKELNSFDKIDSLKLFLYFIQEGKSLYSGKPLNIEDLETYEVDHIIPQTLIKDNSIDNLALVLREENQIKAANFVLPFQYRTEYMKNWWKHLNKSNLISTKKYNNLCRSNYSEKDIEGFINRQLVETRQITKHVANIIKNAYKNTNVIYIPASLSHNYREKFELYKFREINDYHHAHDAYLAAVLGNYKEYYMKLVINFDQIKELNQKLIKEKNYKDLNYGYVINSLDNNMLSYDENGEIMFDNQKFNETVESTLYQNDILISKKTEIRTGEFYNQTKNKKCDKGVPLKQSLQTEKYGSYSSINPAYAVFVKYTVKGKEKAKLIGIPIYIVQNKNAEEMKMYYIRKLLKLSSEDTVTIVKEPIPFHAKLDCDGQICYLCGASDTVEVYNGLEFKFDKIHMQEWKKALVRLFHNKQDIIDTDLYQKQLEDIIEYIISKIEKEYKLYENLVPQLKEMFHPTKVQDFTLVEKENTIIQLMKLLRCNSETANLKFLNSKYSMAFGKKHGRIISTATIINSSVTGLRKNTYEL